MGEYRKIAELDDLGEAGVRELVYDGRIIALIRVGEEVFAIDGICPHQGGPLAEGEKEGCVITCPWHGWRFDLRDGRCLTGRNLAHPTYAVRIVGRDILVALP